MHSFDHTKSFLFSFQKSYIFQNGENLFPCSLENSKFVFTADSFKMLSDNSLYGMSHFPNFLRSCTCMGRKKEQGLMTDAKPPFLFFSTVTTYFFENSSLKSTDRPKFSFFFPRLEKKIRIFFQKFSLQN